MIPKWLNKFNFSKAKKDSDITEKEKEEAILEFKSEVERARRIDDTFSSIIGRKSKHATTVYRINQKDYFSR